MAQAPIHRSGRRRTVFLSGAALIGLWFAIYITYFAPVDVLLKLGPLGARTATFRVHTASDDRVAKRIEECTSFFKACDAAIAANINRVPADDMRDRVSFNIVGIRLSSGWPESEPAIRQLLSRGGDYETLGLFTVDEFRSPYSWNWDEIIALAEDEELGNQIEDKARWMHFRRRMAEQKEWVKQKQAGEHGYDFETL